MGIQFSEWTDDKEKSAQFHTLDPPKILEIIKSPEATKNAYEKLRDDIQNYKIPAICVEAGIQHFNICLFGEIGNGKSSALNSTVTALQDSNDTPNFIAKTGNATESFTKELRKENLNKAGTIKLWDTWGWQKSQTYCHFDELCKGQLTQGQSEKKELESKEKPVNYHIFRPHAILALIDAISSASPDNVNKYKSYIDELKMKYSISVFVTLTKLDRTVDEDDNNILRDRFQGLYDDSIIRDKIARFAELAKLDVAEIHPIINYTGSNEDRNLYKDFYILMLIDKALKQIVRDFNSYSFVRVYDQNNTRQCTVILPCLEVSLAQLKVELMDKYRTEFFNPDMFYDNDGEKIDFNKEKNILLESIVFSRDGNVSCVKIKNTSEKIKNVVPQNSQESQILPSSNSEPVKKFTVHYLGIERVKSTPRISPSATLKQLREDLKIDIEMKFRTKNSTLADQAEESMLKISQIADDGSNITVVVPGELLKIYIRHAPAQRVEREKSEVSFSNFRVLKKPNMTAEALKNVIAECAAAITSESTLTITNTMRKVFDDQVSNTLIKEALCNKQFNFNDEQGDELDQKYEALIPIEEVLKKDGKENYIEVIFAA
jgi:hypothetical protein